MGIDVETILDQKKYFKLKSRILTSNESSLFRSIKIAEHIYGSLIFSAKESLFKALYPLVEKYFYFKDAEIIKINILSCDHEIISGRFKITLLKDLNTDFTSGYHIWGSFFIDLNRDRLVHTSISI
jgi:enterobactin synthetase component D